MKKLGKGCLVIIGVVMMLGILGALLGRGTPASTSGTTNTIQGEARVVSPTQEIAPSPTTAPKSLTIGDDVRVDEMRWKILSAEDLGTTLKSDNQFIKDLKTSGRFVEVRFEMENQSKDLLSYAGLDLVDAEGRSFKTSSDAISFIPEEEMCIFENLNPNIVKICTAIYEVPANATSLQVQVTDLKLFGAATELVDLGLKLK